MSGAIDTLATNVGAQGVGTEIEVYSGEPNGFKKWIKSIEKYAQITNADGAQTKHIVYQASKDAVSDFIHCYITANANSTWNQLKKMNFQLDSQKSRIGNMYITLLRQTKQKLSETVQVYAKWLFALAQ